MLKNCAFDIKLNGFTKSFNSQEELDDFLSKNYSRVIAATQVDGIQFSKNFDPRQETLGKMTSIDMENKGLVATYDQYGNKEENDLRTTARGYQGVTKVINEMTLDGLATSKKLIQPFVIADYVRTQTALAEQALLADPATGSLSKFKIGQMAKAQIQEKVDSWKVLGKMGTDLHAIAQLYFKDGIRDPQEMLVRYNQPLSSELMEKYIGYLDTIRKDMIASSGDPDMVFYSEFAVHDPKSNIVGIIDLVGIDKNGFAHLADFKTAFKKVSDWDTAKTKKSQYQLAFYQQLMMSKGVNVSELTVYPLYLDEADVVNKQVGNIVLEAPINLKQSLLSDKRSIINDVRRELPIDMTPFHKFVGDSNIEGQMQSAFNITTGSLDEPEQVKRFIADNVKTTEEGDKWYYNGVKRVSLEGTDADIEAEISLHLKLETGRIIDKVKNTKDILQRYIEEGTGYRNMSQKGKDDRRLIQRLTYARYTDGTWDIMDIPELHAHGILAFRDKYRGVMEFVVESSANLAEDKKLSKGTNLLGEFYLDKVLDPKDSNLPRLQANPVNLEAMKVLMWYNSNAAELKLKESKLGMIRVVNMTDSNLGMVGVEVDKLIKNYSKIVEILNKKGPNKIEDNFKANKIDIPKYEDLLYSQIVNVLKLGNLDRDELSLSASIQETFGDENLSDRLENLIKIQKKWIQDKNLDPANPDFSTPAGYVFHLLNATIVDIQDIHIPFEAKDINKVSLNRSEMISTPQELEANETIRAAQYPIRQAMNAMADNYITFNGTMRPVFDKFYKDKGVSVLLGNHLSAFDTLFERDPKTGKITKDFKFKNPEDMKNDLGPNDRVFLTKILEQINNQLNPYADLAELKMSGEYYNVPLMRANSVSISHNKTALEAVKDKYDRITDFANLFEEDQKLNRVKAQELLEVHNAFKMSADSRKQRLQTHNVADFDTNVELILGQMAFDNIRKKAYDHVLPTVYAILATSRLVNNGFVNNPLPNLDRSIKDWIKTSVFDEKILEPAHEKIAKKIGALRSGITFLQLAGTPLNLIKETMQGQFNNMAKLMAGQYGKAGASASDYRWAVGFILKESPDFIHNVTLTEELNHLYRMANMDAHQLAEKMKQSKTGMSNFSSRWLLWASGAPDYINRMSLFLAQMKKDGSIDAHKMVNGVLIYDWKQDGRFREYAKGNKAHEDYNMQRALYLRLLQEHNNDSVATGKDILVEGDAIPKAYTTKEQQSFKMFSDYIHGPYDHEAKIKLNHMLLGGMFIQFKTWLSAKKQQYSMAGDTYAVGSWEHYKDVDGQLWYTKTDADGNREMTTEVTNEPYVEWKGRYMEGVWQSLMRTYGEFKKAEYSPKELYNFLKQDETVAGNFKMMSFDLMLFAMFSIAIKGMIDWDELKKDDGWAAAVLKAGINSTSDLSPYANIKAAIDPKALTATISSITTMTEDIGSAVAGHKKFSAIIRNIGIGRTADDLLNLRGVQ